MNNMRSSLLKYTLSLFPVWVMVSSLFAASIDQANGPTFDEAANCIRSRQSPKMFNNEFQVYSRLVTLFQDIKYVVKADDLVKWKELFHNNQGNIYARLCSAYFLLDTDSEARRFVEEQMKSQNLRHRYNATKIVMMYVGIDPTKTWGIDLMIEHLADGSLDLDISKEDSTIQYPDGDEFDVESPIEFICFQLGELKIKRAVPALLASLQRKTGPSQGAITALGEIGDQRANPYLLKKLQDGNDFSAAALGQLKCKEAVPLLISYLQTSPESRQKKSLEYSFEDKTILTALLAIGDSRAIEPIKNYLKEDHPEEFKKVARRVLIELSSVNPVNALIALLDKEQNEFDREDIVWDLIKYDDPEVITKLSSICEISDSASLRRAAIGALGELGTKSALLEIVSVLDRTFSNKLIADIAKQLPRDNTQYFHNLAVEQLRQVTHQDFGYDSAQWRRWIETSSLK